MRAQNRVQRGQSSLLSRYSADLGNAVSRRRSERALRAAAIEQSLASRAKSEFLANMSHELRTPLNAIIGFSELIGHLPDSPDYRSKSGEYAKLIAQAGNHLLAIIADILDIAKIESGTFTLELGVEELSGLVHAAVALVAPRVAEKGQTLVTKLAPDLPPVALDGRRIKQVLINLLSNAHKFTPRGGRILLTAVCGTDGVPVVAVQDSGIGMTQEQIDLALKPFGQVKAAHVRGHDGTGLGLPISRALVAQHGGRLLISSEPDQGTTVAFTLPPRPGTGGSILTAQERAA